MPTNNFEPTLVHCLNRYFTEHRTRGFAYRLKQSRFITQYVDIIVDSPDPSFYLAIECKSLKGNRLSFASNFHRDKDGIHQIDNITSFLRFTGRRGFLAVEFRGGRRNACDDRTRAGGKSPRANEAYLMDWGTVLAFFATQASIPIEEFRQGVQLERTAEGYRLDTLPAAGSGASGLPSGNRARDNARMQGTESPCNRAANTNGILRKRTLLSIINLRLRIISIMRNIDEPT